MNARFVLVLVLASTQNLCFTIPVIALDGCSLNWRIACELFLVNSDSTALRRMVIKNFGGMVPDNKDIKSPPYVFLDYDTDSNKWIFSGGFEAELLKALSKHLNFTYNIINCNSDWGILLPNNTWTGIIGNVYSKRADFGFGSLTVTNKRSEAVLFSNPHIITSVSYITPPPKTESNIALVIEPFDSTVWICFIISFILMLLNEWLISQYYTKLKKIDISWAIISTTLRQTISYCVPSVGPLRMMLCCWLMACLVLTSSYGGCLYSIMTVPTKMKTIDTVTELANAQKNGRIQVVATESSAYYHSLKDSQFGVHREIGALIKPVINKRIGFDIVRNSTKPYAFISTRDHLVDGLNRFGKKYFYLPPPTEESSLFFAIMAIALQKEFQYKNEFNKFISDIKKGGFLEYWKVLENRKIQHFSDFDEEDDQIHKKLHLNQLQSALYMFIIFILISIFIVITETVLIFRPYFKFIFKIFAFLSFCG